MNYTALLHTHRLAVTLFLIVYLVKFTVMLAKPSNLEWVSKRIRIPEIIVSVLFLLTGALMWTQMAEPLRSSMLIKVLVVLVSIPVAVVGFKRKNKVMAALAVLLILAAYGLGEAGKKSILKPRQLASYNIAPNDPIYDIALHGKQVYGQYCVVCHGEAGDLGLSGAKNLRISTKTESEIADLLERGKNSMPSYSGVLNEQETAAVITYVLTLRK